LLFVHSSHNWMAVRWREQEHQAPLEGQQISDGDRPLGRDRVVQRYTPVLFTGIWNYCEARLSSSLDASPQAHISSRDWEHQLDARLRPARHINCDEAALWLGRSSF